ncbi:hypothetical protein VA596_38750 [Amycolatopsis sp., V23-08]|uniref:Uncharacterized protein n=1 Tax=Amycolatopsis heterodermiae TaxID=3110235 RepID=A0ABU5RGW6_9PSEU|nr:hypothetical protein [Amycolatopsis sp., V23-08]MEA5365518.1 hypothetical protein [Amycolatopsis sp., V23-08]
MGELDHTFGLVPVNSVPPSDYEYWAVVNRFYPDVDDPSTVVRVWEFLPGRFLEENLNRDLEWVHTERPSEPSEGEAVRISEEAARRFETIQARRARTERGGPRYRYYAMLRPFHPHVADPACVGRKWDDGNGNVLEELYSLDCEWVRNTGWSERNECVEIDAAAARRFEKIQAKRYRSALPPGGRFNYTAIASSVNRDEVRGLVRWWTSGGGYRREEDFHPRDGRWRRGFTLEDIDRGSNWADTTEISEKEAKRLQESLVARLRPHFEKQSRVYEYYAITGEGRPVDDPLTVIRVWTPRRGAPVEERYSEELDWEPSELRHRVAGHRVVRIDESRLYNFTVLQYQRAQRRPPGSRLASGPDPS